MHPTDESPVSRGPCLDCDTPLDDARFCPGCGQRTAIGRLRWQDMFRDIHHQLLEGNLPWPRTLWCVTRDPGGVAREYVAGKRARYVHPLKYAFYLVLIATILMPDSGGTGQLVEEQSQLSWWRGFLLTSPPVFMLLISPVAVVTLRLCFWRPYNTIEIWVLVLYLLGQLSLLLVALGAMNSIANIIVQRDEFLMAIIGVLSLMVIVVYYMWGVRRFFRGRADWSLVGALLCMMATLWVGAMLFGWLMEPLV